MLPRLHNININYVNEVETILHEIRDHRIFVNISKFP